MLNKAAFNPSVACQSQPGSSGPMRAEQTMPAQLQMDRSCSSLEHGQTALVSCLHCRSATCYASRSLAHAWGGLLMAPRWLGGNMEQALLPSKYWSRSLCYHQIERARREVPESWAKVTSHPDRNISSNSFTGKLEREKELKSMCLTSFSHVYWGPSSGTIAVAILQSNIK